MGSTALAKLFIMAMSGLLAIITGRLIIEHFGVAAYAQYGLLATLPALLPFADLGVGSVVINAVSASKDPTKDSHVQRTIVSALRILVISGLGICFVGIFLTISGAWPIILGDALLGKSGEFAVMYCVIIFGASLPLTIGQRLLISLNRNTSQTMTQAIVAPFMLGTVALSVLLLLPVGPYLAVYSYLANSIVSILCLYLVLRHFGSGFVTCFAQIPLYKKYPSVPTMKMAWPMLVQMIALPLAMQIDRILLSHLSGSEDVAEYNLAAQLFGMAIQVINASALVMWPHFSRARAAGEVRSPFAPTLIYAAFGLGISAGLALIAPILADFMSNGKIALSTALLLSFIGFTTLQAARYPASMYMTDFKGLKFQLLPIFIMIPLNLFLSIVLIGSLGAAGTVLATCICIVLCRLLPNFIYVHRDLKLRREEQESVITN